jgi:hypothetical protein
MAVEDLKCEFKFFGRLDETVAKLVEEAKKPLPPAAWSIEESSLERCQLTWTGVAGTR